jgi:hypothetical protein
MAMAQVAYPDPGHEIQVFLPLHVPDLAPLSPNQDDREPPIGLGENFLRDFDHILVFHLLPFQYIFTTENAETAEVNKSPIQKSKK